MLKIGQSSVSRAIIEIKQHLPDLLPADIQTLKKLRYNSALDDGQVKERF